MNRREAWIALLLELAGLASTASAQQARKMRRIGVLGNNLAMAPAAVDAFRRRLRELGHVEGVNVVMEYRSADGNPERLAGDCPVFLSKPLNLPEDRKNALVSGHCSTGSAAAASRVLKLSIPDFSRACSASR